MTYKRTPGDWDYLPSKSTDRTICVYGGDIVVEKIEYYRVDGDYYFSRFIPLKRTGKCKVITNFDGEYSFVQSYCGPFGLFTCWVNVEDIFMGLPETSVVYDCREEMPKKGLK